MAHLISVDGGTERGRLKNSKTQLARDRDDRRWSRKNVAMVSQQNRGERVINNTHEYAGLMNAADYKAKREALIDQEGRREAEDARLAKEAREREPAYVAKQKALAKKADEEFATKQQKEREERAAKKKKRLQAELAGETIEDAGGGEETQGEKKRRKKAKKAKKKKKEAARKKQMSTLSFEEVDEV
jgi:hypothetical protein